MGYSKFREKDKIYLVLGLISIIIVPITIVFSFVLLGFSINALIVIGISFLVASGLFVGTYYNNLFFLLDLLIEPISINLSSGGIHVHYLIRKDKKFSKISKVVYYEKKERIEFIAKGQTIVINDVHDEIIDYFEEEEINFSIE